jgi:tetratricopeptide (TPR) repeat protein
VVDQVLAASVEADALNLLRSTERAKRLVLSIALRTLPGNHRDLQGASESRPHHPTLGDLSGARELQETVQDVYVRTLPADHADLQRALMNLAATLAMLGDLHGACALEEKVLEVRTRTLPDDHPDLQSIRANHALTIRALGDLAGARTLQEKVLEVFTRTLADDHPHLQLTRMNLAVTVKELGDLPRARVLEEKLLEVYSRTLPGDHPDLQRARLNLAATLYPLGDLAGARSLLEKALEVLSRTMPAEHPDLQLARDSLAITLRAVGDVASARSLQEKVLEVRSRTLPEDHPDLQKARQSLAITIGILGDLAGARELGEGARDPLAHVVRGPSRSAGGSSEPRRHAEAPRRPPGSAGPRGESAGGALAHAPGRSSRFAARSSEPRDDARPAREPHGIRTLQERVLEVRSRTLPDDQLDLQAVRGGIWPSRSLCNLRTPRRVHRDRQPMGRRKRRTRGTGMVRWSRPVPQPAPCNTDGDPQLFEPRGGRDASPPRTIRWAACSRRLRGSVCSRSIRTGSVRPSSFRKRLEVRRCPRPALRVPQQGSGLLDHRASARSSCDTRAARPDRSDHGVVRERAGATRGCWIASRGSGRQAVGRRRRSCSIRASTPSRCVKPREAPIAYRSYARSMVARGTPHARNGSPACVRSLFAEGAEPVTRRMPREPRSGASSWARLRRSSVPWSSGARHWVLPRGVVSRPARTRRDSTPPGEALRALVLDPLREALRGVDRVLVALDDVLNAVPLDALPAGDPWRVPDLPSDVPGPGPADHAPRVALSIFSCGGRRRVQPDCWRWAASIRFGRGANAPTPSIARSV